MAFSGYSADKVSDRFFSQHFFRRLQMTASYNKEGIRFSYPENWELSEERGDLGYPLTVSVARDSAFWSVVVYNDVRDTNDLCQQALKVMQSEEYIDFESWPTSRQIGERDLAGIRMHFYCLDFLVASCLLGVNLAGRTLLFQYQAEDREFEGLLPVFDAMATSLLASSGEELDHNVDL